MGALDDYFKQSGNTPTPLATISPIDSYFGNTKPAFKPSFNADVKPISNFSLGTGGTTTQSTAPGTQLMDEISSRIVKTISDAGIGVYNDTKNTLTTNPVTTFNNLTSEIGKNTDNATNNLLQSASRLRNSQNPDEVIANGLDTAQAIANFTFSSVNALFDVANKIPGVNIISRGASALLGTGADVLGPVFKDIVLALPLSPEHKAMFQDRADQLGQLVGTVTVGGELYSEGEGAIQRVLGNDVPNQFAKAKTPEQISSLLDEHMPNLSQGDKAELTPKLVEAKNRGQVSDTFKNYAKEQVDSFVNVLKEEANRTADTNNKLATLNDIPGTESITPTLDKYFANNPTSPTEPSLLPSGEKVALPEPQKLLEGPKPSNQGEGFTFSDKVDKVKLDKWKSFLDARDALDKYNQKPTPGNLAKVIRARELLKRATEAEAPKKFDEVFKPTPKVEAKTTETKTAPVIKSEIPDQNLKTSEPLKAPIKNELPPIDNQGNRTSGVAKSIEAKAIEARLTTGFENKAGFDSSSFKEEAQKTADLINSGIDNARAVVRGEQPTDIKAGALIAGMEEYAKTHPKEAGAIYEELANSHLASTISTGASEMSFARMREPDSATAQLKEIKDNLVRKAGGEEKIKKFQKSVVDATNKVLLPKEAKSWDNFLKQITC